MQGLVFLSRDPFNERAWSEPVRFPILGIDPDIFFDDNDEGVYVTVTDSQHILHQPLNLSTGITGPVTHLWNGTGLQNPEGPHLYKKIRVLLPPSRGGRHGTRSRSDNSTLATQDGSVGGVSA